MVTRNATNRYWPRVPVRSALLSAVLLASVAASVGCGEGAAGAGSGEAGSESGAGTSHGGSPGGSMASGGTGTPAGGAGSGGSGVGGSGAPPHIVKACDELPAEGVWEEITPPVMPLAGNEPCPYGGAFVMDPQDPTTLYVGSCNQGIWKSSDCGASWQHINTGKNGAVLDGGRQWTFSIDPVDSKVLYANSGYGKMSNGAFKSTDGGVNWEQLWPPTQADLAKVVEYNFVAQVVMDPSDHEHLLITFHAKCAAPHSEACFGESHDAGASWKLIDGQADWAGGEGQFIYFLDSSSTWLWGSQSNGLWRTENAGVSWKPVTDKMAQGHGAGQMYRAADGVFYLPVLGGILRSPDGITWTLVPDSGSVMAGLTGDGMTMWASRGFPWDPSDKLYLPFWSSAESDGQTWKQLDSPKLSNGGALRYDADHHILYSSNLGAGFWRVVVAP
jgi:hypothetical protein